MPSLPIVTSSVGNGYVSARFTGSGFIKPNNGGGLGANTSSTDIVTSLKIVEVKWAVDTATTSKVVIARGGTTVLNLAGAGSMDLNNNTLETTAEQSANCVVTITGTGSCVIKFHKTSSLSTGIY